MVNFRTNITDRQQIPQEAPVAEKAKTSKASSSIQASTEPVDTGHPPENVWKDRVADPLNTLEAPDSVDTTKEWVVLGEYTTKEGDKKVREFSVQALQVMAESTGDPISALFQEVLKDFQGFAQGVEQNRTPQLATGRDREPVSAELGSPQNSKTDVTLAKGQVRLPSGHIATIGKELGRGSYNAVYQLVIDGGKISDYVLREPIDISKTSRQHQTAEFLQRNNPDGRLKNVESAPRKTTYKPTGEDGKEVKEQVGWCPRYYNSGSLYNYIADVTIDPSLDELSHVDDGIMNGYEELKELGIVHRDYKIENGMLHKEEGSDSYTFLHVDFDGAFEMKGTTNYEEFRKHADETGLKESLVTEFSTLPQYEKDGTALTNYTFVREGGKLSNMKVDLKELLEKENPSEAQKKEMVELAREILIGEQELSTYLVGIMRYILFARSDPPQDLNIAHQNLLDSGLTEERASGIIAMLKPLHPKA